VRRIVIIAALLCAAGAAAAQSAPTGVQNSAAPLAKPVEAVPRAKRPLAVVIPQQFAPPQEDYASFPESAAAAAPTTPSACQLRLAKIAAFQALPTLVGPGDCGASDAVLMGTIILPDQGKVAVTPPATMRCPMAEAVAHWVRDDVAPSLQDQPPLRGLDNVDS
jgi:hypothetical protein